MAHGGFAEANRSGEVAVAYFALIGAKQQRNEFDSDRVG
jgi:hypothetical protein